jgi:molecular chaperone DnaK
VMTKLIERNTTIPTRKSETFSTAADGQTQVEIHVLQGEREMAANNRTLGRFNLDGIPPAPRGVPQVEVTFDIDANGILHVQAKDKATGREQKIQMTASSGLDENEIKKMVEEAQSHVSEDKKRREEVEQRNKLDTLVYQTEKLTKENKERIPVADLNAVEAEIAKAHEVLKGTDTDAIRTALDSLTAASHKMAEAMYKQSGGPTEGPGGGPTGAEGGPAEGGNGGSAGKKDGDVIDAEFE